MDKSISSAIRLGDSVGASVKIKQVSKRALEMPPETLHQDFCPLYDSKLEYSIYCIIQRVVSYYTILCLSILAPPTSPYINNKPSKTIYMWSGVVLKPDQSRQ